MSRIENESVHHAAYSARHTDYTLYAKRYTLIICTLFLVLCSSTNSEQRTTNNEHCALQIYLPREITIQEDCLTVGQVGIIRGEESLVARASEVALGRISVPGQKIVIDRSTLLSRLACNGIPTSKLSLTGAEKITVRKQQQVIKGEEFVELASSFLKKPAGGGNDPVQGFALAADSVCQLNPVQTPKDLILPGRSCDVRLSPRLVEGGAKNQAKVQITVFASDPVGGDKEIGTREVIFRLKFNRHSVVTLTEIPAGAVISPENVKIEKIVSDQAEGLDRIRPAPRLRGDKLAPAEAGVGPEPEDWRPPYGLIAKRRLPANTVVRPDMLSSVEPTTIERNETVVLRIDRPGLLVTALGKAMQKGQAGEYIKVRNLDSQRIILCRVVEDGTVEPIF